MTSVCSQETVPFEPLCSEQKINLREEIATRKKTLSQEEDSRLQETFSDEDLENGKVNWRERIKYVNDWVETNKTNENQKCVYPFENCEDIKEVTMAGIDGVVEISDDEDSFNQEKPENYDSDLQILKVERLNVARKKRKRSSKSRKDEKKLKVHMQDVAVGEDCPAVKSYCNVSVQTERQTTESKSTQMRPPFCFNSSVQTDSVIRHTKDTQTVNYLLSTKNSFCQTSPTLIDAPVGVSLVKSPQKGCTLNFMTREERDLMQRPLNLVNSQNIKEFIMLIVLYQSLLDQHGLIMYLSKRNAKSNWDAERSNLQSTEKMVKERAAGHLVKVKSSYKNLTCDEMSFFKKILMESISDWTAKPDCHVKVNACSDPFNWVLPFVDNVMNNTVPIVSDRDSVSSVETDDQTEVKAEVSQKSPVYGDLPPEVSSNSVAAPMTVIPLDSTALEKDSPEFNVLPEQNSSAPSERQGDTQQDTAPQNNAVQSPEHRGSHSSSQALDLSHQGADFVQVPPTSLNQAQFAPANSSMISEYARSASLDRSLHPPMGPNQHWSQTQHVLQPHRMYQCNNQQMQGNVMEHRQRQNQQGSSGTTNYVDQSLMPVNNARVHVRKDLMQATQPLQQPLTQPLQQPLSQQLQQTLSQPLQQPLSQQLQQSLTQPLQQPLSQQLQQTLSQPLQQPLSQQLQQPLTQQLQQSLTQPLQQSLTQPLQQSLTQPLQQTLSQQLQQPLSQQLQHSSTQQLQYMQSTNLPITQVQTPPAKLGNQIPVHVTTLPVRMDDILCQRLQPGARRNSYSIEQPASLAYNGPYQQSQNEMHPPPPYPFNSQWRNVYQIQAHVLQHQPSTAPLQASSSHMTTSTMYQSSVAQNSQEQTTREQPSSESQNMMPLRRMSTSMMQLPPYMLSQNLRSIRPPSYERIPQQQRVGVVPPYQVPSRQSTTQVPSTLSKQPPLAKPWTVPVQQNVQNMVVSLPSSQQSSTVVSTTTQTPSISTSTTLCDSLSTLVMPPPPVLASRICRGRRMSVDTYNTMRTATQTSGAKQTFSAGIIQVPSRSAQQTEPQEMNQPKQQVVENKSVSDLHRRQDGTEEGPQETVAIRRSEGSVEQVSLAEHEEEANTEEGQPSISPEMLSNMKKSMKVCNICNEKSNQICGNCLSAVYCGTECAKQDIDHLCDEITFIFFE